MVVKRLRAPHCSVWRRLLAPLKLGFKRSSPTLPFSNLEIVLAAVALLSALVAGGEVLRQGQPKQELLEEIACLEEKAASQVAEGTGLAAKCTALACELSAAQAQLQQLQADCKTAQADGEAAKAQCSDAREEAELILLQLHQVQEELEHYFLLSQDLQQQLDQGQASNQPAVDQRSGALVQHTTEELQRIKQRLSSLLQQDPSSTRSALWALIRRQQAALKRFERLHRSRTTPLAQTAPRAVPVAPAPIADGDVVMI